jgi:hypothetical protein
MRPLSPARPGLISKKILKPGVGGILRVAIPHHQHSAFFFEFAGHTGA